MRVGTPIIKKGRKTHVEAFARAQDAYLAAYLRACQAAPACDPVQKREKARVYSEGLLTQGGPATDPVKKSLGEEATAAFFRKTLFGTDD